MHTKFYKHYISSLNADKLMRFCCTMKSKQINFEFKKEVGITIKSKEVGT